MSTLDDLVSQALSRAGEARAQDREQFVAEVRQVVSEEVFEALHATLDPLSRILHFEFQGHKYIIYKTNHTLRVAHPDFGEWESLYSPDDLLVYLGTRNIHHHQ